MTNIHHQQTNVSIMFISKMIRLSSTTTTNSTLLLSSSSSSSTSLNILKRFSIVFGSICFLWLIMGLIYASIQTFRHFKRRSYYKNRLLLPVLLESPTKIDENDHDDQTSILTSISFLSDKSKTPILDESPIEPAQPAFLDYSACQNFAFSHSTLASLTDSIHQQQRTHSSRSSTNTTFSQITHATYLTSSSSIKPLPLPTVMITDCDRLQTDIIELEHFEPEKEWRRVKPELRLLLNERMPQAVR